MSKSGKRLLAAADEALLIAAGATEPKSKYIPADVDVRKIRASIGATQDQFAAEFGFTTSQIRDWEQARNRPIGVVRMYLMMIAHDPDGVRRMLASVSTAAHVDAALAG